jgi:arabinogalactan endo-1,4-beta-galactosidase
MNVRYPLIAVAVVCILGNRIAVAGQTFEDVGTMACVTDKWDETEPEKGHKLVDFAGRCINVVTADPAMNNAGDCVGKYEYMPDGSWKGSGTCTYKYKGGDTANDSWEEGSHLKNEYIYKFTGGTGKFQGASGGGTYFYESITDTLAGGTYKGQLVLP